MHHEKADLKVFVVVIRKEGLGGWSPPDGGSRIGRAPARQSFFGYDNDKDFKVCFLVTRQMSEMLGI